VGVFTTIPRRYVVLLLANTFTSTLGEQLLLRHWHLLLQHLKLIVGGSKSLRSNAGIQQEPQKAVCSISMERLDITSKVSIGTAQVHAHLDAFLMINLIPYATDLKKECAG